MEHNYDTIDLYDLVRKIFQFLLRTWKAALPVLLLCGTVQADCRWDSRAADCWQGYAAFERREAERRRPRGREEAKVRLGYPGCPSGMVTPTRGTGS